MFPCSLVLVVCVCVNNNFQMLDQRWLKTVREIKRGRVCVTGVCVFSVLGKLSELAVEKAFRILTSGFLVSNVACLEGADEAAWAYPGSAGGWLLLSGGDLDSAALPPFVRLLCWVVWDPELQLRYFCMLWAQAPGQPAQQQPCGWSCWAWLAKGGGLKRLLCSLSGNEELKIFLIFLTVSVACSEWVRVLGFDWAARQWVFRGFYATLVLGQWSSCHVIS